MQWHDISEQPNVSGYYWVAYDSPKHYGLPRQTWVGLFTAGGWELVNGLDLSNKAVAWAEIDYPSPPNSP